jgi:hypothetical protein
MEQLVFLERRYDLVCWPYIDDNGVRGKHALDCNLVGFIHPGICQQRHQRVLVTGWWSPCHMCNGESLCFNGICEEIGTDIDHG